MTKFHNDGIMAIKLCNKIILKVSCLLSFKERQKPKCNQKCLNKLRLRFYKQQKKIIGLKSWLWYYKLTILYLSMIDSDDSNYCLHFNIHIIVGLNNFWL